MSDTPLTGCEGGARLGVAGLLTLAAAPTFATLALLSGVSGGEAMCSASPFNSMAAMYGLMAAFHLPAWLRRAK